MSPISDRPGDRAALERLLGGPAISWLVGRVRDRILAADGASLAGVVRLDSPTVEQRAAATKLVGLPRRSGESLRLDLADVEEVLRRGPWPAGLADAVVTLTGPVIDQLAERAQEAADWAQAASGLRDVAAPIPGLEQWWDQWCRSGKLKRAAHSEAIRLGGSPGPDVAARLVDELARVMVALPAKGVPLAVFARQTLGGAHALDESRPLGRLARATVAAAFGSTTSRELSARGAWASAGVVMSNVSSTVLTLGVVGGNGAAKGSLTGGLDALGVATASTLEAMRTARAPVILTLDQVRSGGIPALPATGVVHVCENPTVVEVVGTRWAAQPADGSFGAGPVLVCTSGQPSTAVMELLELLTAGGAECRYHGDFDWAGLHIARVVQSRVGWTPWRFSAADYRSAADEGDSAVRLSGRPVDAPWDAGLTPAMAETGMGVEEEAVAELLADDLVGPSE
ncbi:MAG TPA: TIGR02679 family protein [Nocardioidaceae bacterium]|nr:TIGR02679 family protein [Nocardioidaceae bacterium]